jgi:4-diphosphocytidyl-2-C-methyl-D-erythritol kinase
MEFSAPAKINLSLRVLRKREDGFHEIESLMVPISICDTLDVGRTGSGGLRFTCSDPGLPAGSGNLVVRAVGSFCDATGIEPDLRIHLQKRIPHGAGLGGGSSDAAATLLALDQLFETRLSRGELFRLAASLGSDVPFFIAQSAAWCRGRGEIVEPCLLAETLPLLLIKPPFPVPTPWAYQRWRDSIEIPGVPYAAQRFEWGEMVNDLERPVFEKHLQLAEMKRWLLEQPEAAGALMSGSGSTVFALLREESAGRMLMEKVAAQFGSHVWQSLARTKARGACAENATA